MIGPAMILWAHTVALYGGHIPRDYFVSPNAKPGNSCTYVHPCTEVEALWGRNVCAGDYVLFFPGKYAIGKP